MSYQGLSRYRSPRGGYAGARYQNPEAGWQPAAGYQDPAGYPDPHGYQGLGGYQDPADYQDPAGYPDPDGYRGLGGYQDPRFTDTVSYQDPELAAPGRHAANGWSRRGRGSRGFLSGIVTGLLSGAMAIGVAILAAAFVRPQASPVIAVGEAAIDRTPSAVKEFAIQYFGQNDKNVLLLGMYVVIAIIAMTVGVLGRRRLAVGVIGMAAFGVFGAFVALTRPESHATDGLPSLIGGAAGVAALIFLVRSAAPQSLAAVTRRTRGGYRRPGRMSAGGAGA